MAQPGEEILSSDIGEGTLATPFMRQCVSRCLPGEGSWKNVRRRNIRLPGGLLNKQPLHLCLPGWYAHNNACARCTAPRQVVQGTRVLCKEHSRSLCSQNMLSPGQPTRPLHAHSSASCSIHGQVLLRKCPHLSCAAAHARRGPRQKKHITTVTKVSPAGRARSG